MQIPARDGSPLFSILQRILDVSGQTSLYITIVLYFRELEIQDHRFQLQNQKNPISWLDCALSSTSNTSMTTSVPLDIVLVLDVSGSMNDSMGTTDVYEETYNVNENGTYYALNANGEYEEIKAVTTGALWWEEFDHWELNGVTVEPKTRNDNDTTHIQFYTRREVNVSKIDALKTAVNGFIDATATQNETIAYPGKNIIFLL